MLPTAAGAVLARAARLRRQRPEEFFAVATEVYFERPAALRREAPDLYEELHRFYGWDPPAEPARRRKRHGPGKRKRKRRRKR